MKKSLVLVFCFILFGAALLPSQIANGATARRCQGNSCDTTVYPSPLPPPSDKKGNIGATTKSGGGNLNPANIESDARSAVSFWTTLFMSVCGLWAIATLLLNYFHRQKPNHRFFVIFSPRLALSSLAIVFAFTIFGSWLTMPSGVSAQKKRQKPSKANFGLIPNPANEPVFSLVNKIGGSGITQTANPVFDANGNQYITGGFTGALPIGSTTLNANADFDMFVAKYDSSGNALWARKGSGVTSGVPTNFALEAGNYLAVDSNGNVYVGGGFAKQITLQGGSNPDITLTDGGGADINYEPYLAKYNSSGDLLWAIGGNSGSPRDLDNFGTGFNAINGIVFDGSGNPYIFGTFSGTNFLGASVTNSGESDAILVKINPTNGAIIWQQTIGGINGENGLSLGIDGANNLYIFGNFQSDSITFPTSPTPTTFSNSDDLNDSFIAKYDSDGTIQWAKQLGGASNILANSISVTSSGDIAVVGSFFDSVTFSTTPNPTVLTENESGSGEDGYGGFVAVMNSSGDWQWAKGFGGLGNAVKFSSLGEIYVVGIFYDGGIFGAGTPREESLASFGGEDQFISRYNSNGDFVWSKPITGSGSESSNLFNRATLGGDYKPLGVTQNPFDGEIYISGDFSGAITFDCNTIQSPTGARQAFITKLADSTAESCRIWNGFDPDDNNWDSVDNWNGNTVPTDGESVYIPYTGNSFDNPTYNPSVSLSSLNNLTIADDRTLTVTQNLTVNGTLWLLGGYADVNAGQELIVGDFASLKRTADVDGNGGFVRGKLRKNFGEDGDPQTFTFHVGNTNSYLPVQAAIPPIMSATMAVEAINGIEPTLPNQTNALNKYWNLSGTNVFPANLTFSYTDAEILGNEADLKLFKINPPNAVLQNTAVYNFAGNSVSINGVNSFSNWALGALAPTAASVDIRGKIMTSDGRGISKATITLTDQAGNKRPVLSNNFGFYTFEEVAIGQNYVVTVRSKRHTFEPRLINLTESVSDFNFIDGK